MLLLKPFTEDHGRSAVHPPFYFHYASWFATTILAHMLDSLVRVRSEERRVGKGVDLGGRRIIKKKKGKSPDYQRILVLNTE